MPLPQQLPPPPLKVGMSGTGSDQKVWTIRGWMRLCTADIWWDEWLVTLGDEQGYLRYEDGQFSLERPKDGETDLPEFDQFVISQTTRGYTLVFARVSDVEGDMGRKVAVDDRIKRVDFGYTVAVMIGDDRRSFVPTRCSRSDVRKTFGIDATTFQRSCYALPKLASADDLMARQSGTLLENLPALAVVVGLVVGLIYLMKACG